MKIHDFYRRNNLRVHEIPVGKKCPIAIGWPDACKKADEIEPLLGGHFNKYGWLLDDNHVVIDIDLHNDEENGIESLERLVQNSRVDLDKTCKAVVYSPSGGRHYYFTKPAGVQFGKVFKSFYPGIDFISGKGKQVIAANSFHDKYAGTYTLAEDAELVEIPEALLQHLVELTEHRSKSVEYVANQDRSGDEFNRSAKGLEFMINCMKSCGYVVRQVAGYYEFDRPNKSSDSKCSGHLGKKSKQGNYQLTCFTLSDPHFPSGESQNMFKAYADLMHGGDFTRASKALYEAGFAVNEFFDSSASLRYADTSEIPYHDDEDFCEAMLPDDGLLRSVFDFYLTLTRRPSNIIGLAVAVAFCEALFGRRVRSFTDMRTHDYTIIVAPTNCGKESCVKTIQKLVYGSIPNSKFLIPPNVQSGNGLLAAVADSPACMWLCDEFGTFLEGALDRRQATKHTREIVDHLLQMYTRAEGTYMGAAHASGAKNKIEQPSLSLLGITTGSTLFENIDRKQVESGLFGRCSFWPVQTRPPLMKNKISTPSTELIELVSCWLTYEPMAYPGTPVPELPQIKFSQDAQNRWEEHEESIDQKMMEESELRAAVWGRTAGRSMKLAMVHRCSRLECNPSSINWDFVYVERVDIDWGIQISNWLARTACDYATCRVGDFSADSATKALSQILQTKSGEWVSRSAILRAARDLTAGDVGAAAKKLSEFIELRSQKKSRGRPEVQYRWKAK